MNTPIEITHVVYADAIGYSRLSFEQKRRYDEALARLSQRLFEGLAVVARVDNGDGVAIAILGEPRPVVEAAIRFHSQLEQETGVRTRFGVHSGLAYARSDVAGHESLTGPAIEFAQRVMVTSQGETVRLSRAMRDLLLAYPEFEGRIAPGEIFQAKEGRVTTYRVFDGPRQFALLFGDPPLTVAEVPGFEVVVPSAEFPLESSVAMLEAEKPAWVGLVESDSPMSQVLANRVPQVFGGVVRLRREALEREFLAALRSQSSVRLATDGPVPADAPYVRRAADEQLRQAIRERESVILLRGAKGYGKSSMLLRLPAMVRAQGARELFIDLGAVDQATLSEIESFYRWVIDRMFRGLAGAQPPAWENWVGPNSNLENAIVQLAEHGELVVVFDAVDRLFDQPYRHDFFGLLRSWHNRRAVAMDARWDRVSILLAYAGDAQSVLLDVNQSPFNVGRRVDLEAFSIEEVATLAAGSGADVDAVFALAGGHPQLTAMLVARGTQREEASAVTESIRPSSLMRHLGSRLDGPLRSAVAAVMKGQAPAPDELWMLVGLGLVSLRADGTAIPANRIFAEWMAKKLRG